MSTSTLPSDFRDTGEGSASSLSRSVPELVVSFTKKPATWLPPWIRVSSTGAQSRRDFKIVGSNEADPRNGKISDESAVGKALIGAKVGDVIEVETPAGISKYHIVTISR